MVIYKIYIFKKIREKENSKFGEGGSGQYGPFTSYKINGEKNVQNVMGPFVIGVAVPTTNLNFLLYSYTSTFNEIHAWKDSLFILLNIH